MAGIFNGKTVGLVAQLSGGASLQEKTITENGVYMPDSGYDGLSKVTVSVQAPTKGTVQTFCTDVIANHVVSDSWQPTTTVRDTTPFSHYKDSAAEVSSGTTLTSSVNCNVGDLVIAAIVVRSALTISDGWTLISTSTAIDGDTYNQTLSWAYKYAENTSESITVTQASANRIYINMASLQGATGFVDNGFIYDTATDTTTFTTAKPSGLVLWAASKATWDTSSTHGLWSISNDSTSTQLGTTTQSRLALFYDQSNDETVTFTTGETGVRTFGSLTIQGMDKFVDYKI